MILIPSTYARIHYLGPASTLGTFLISFSILFQEGFSSAGIKSILFALFIVMYGPVLSHAASRAKRIRVYGIWQQWDVSKKRKKK
jgi:multicomponent Na+:H+ antiporter subunit G